MVLEELVEFLYNVDGDAGFQGFSEFLVDAYDVDEFVREVVF